MRTLSMQESLSPSASSIEPGSNHLLRDSVHFWERGRLVYNGAQLLLTGLMLLVQLSKAHFFVANVGNYLFYAIAANLLYTFAYAVEPLFLIPVLRPHARPVRLCLLIGGTVLACCLAFYLMQFEILREPFLD